MPQAFTFLLPLDFWKLVHNLVRNRVFPEKGTSGHSRTRIGLMCGASKRSGFVARQVKWRASYSVAPNWPKLVAQVKTHSLGRVAAVWSDRRPLPPPPLPRRVPGRPRADGDKYKYVKTKIREQMQMRNQSISRSKNESQPNTYPLN